MTKIRKISIAGDHAGFGMKKRIGEYLEGKGFSVKDLGSYSPEDVDYPDFAHSLAESVESGESDIGISLCGTGNGVSMAANKHEGIRSAICWSKDIAGLARAHNNANICALPARFLSYDEVLEILDAFLYTEFEGGRHERRIKKIPIRK